jgi:hypothetical protein
MEDVSTARVLTLAPGRSFCGRLRRWGPAPSRGKAAATIRVSGGAGGNGFKGGRRGIRRVGPEISSAVAAGRSRRSRPCRGAAVAGTECGRMGMTGGPGSSERGRSAALAG